MDNGLADRIAESRAILLHRVVTEDGDRRRHRVYGQPHHASFIDGAADLVLNTAAGIFFADHAGKVSSVQNL